MKNLELNAESRRRGIGLAMIVWRKEAKRIAPKRKRTMANSIYTKVGKDSTGNYAGYIATSHARLRGVKFHYPFSVHDGHKAFTIHPKNKPFLAFQIQSKWIYTKKPVNIPATKGRPFFDISYNNKRSEMNKKILDGVTLK